MNYIGLFLATAALLAPGWLLAGCYATIRHFQKGPVDRLTLAVLSVPALVWTSVLAVSIAQLLAEVRGSL